MLLEALLVTTAVAVSALMPTPIGSLPTVTVEVTVPPTKSTSEALLLPRFVTTALPSREMTATPCGLVPTAMVLVTVPLVRSIRETLPQPVLVTTARLRSASMATAPGAGAVHPELLTSTDCRTVKSAMFECVEPVTTSRAKRRGAERSADGTGTVSWRAVTPGGGGSGVLSKRTTERHAKPLPRTITAQGEAGATTLL